MAQKAQDGPIVEPVPRGKLLAYQTLYRRHGTLYIFKKREVGAKEEWDIITFAACGYIGTVGFHNQTFQIWQKKQALDCLEDFDSIYLTVEIVVFIYIISLVVGLCT